MSEAPANRAGFPAIRFLQAIALAAVLGLLGLLIWRVARGEAGGGFVAAIRAGKRPAALEFALPVIWRHDETWPAGTRRALADERIALGELRGYPVVLNFWASWCGPCKDETPLLQKSWLRWEGKDVVFVGINVKDFRGDARSFVRRFGVTYPNVYDGKGSTVGRYGVTGFPETYFIDANGRVVYRIAGPVADVEELDSGIRRALAPA